MVTSCRGQPAGVLTPVYRQCDPLNWDALSAIKTGVCDMSIRTIAKMGHPILKQVAEPVADPTDPTIRALATDMQDTLQEIGASGIAAPQVFVSKRVVVYRMIPARIPKSMTIPEVPWTVMVNPEITPLSEETIMAWERCLSIPTLHGLVPRHARIAIRYQTLTGETVENEAHGTWSALLQHECDHLDGVLYPMRMDDLTTLSFNEAPGALGQQAQHDPDSLDPLFLDMVAHWPNREKWLA